MFAAPQRSPPPSSAEAHHDASRQNRRAGPRFPAPPRSRRRPPAHTRHARPRAPPATIAETIADPAVSDSCTRRGRTLRHDQDVVPHATQCVVRYLSWCGAATCHAGGRLLVIIDIIGEAIYALTCAYARCRTPYHTHRATGSGRSPAARHRDRRLSPTPAGRGGGAHPYGSVGGYVACSGRGVLSGVRVG